MEDPKIIYMTREEIRGIDRSKIQSMQMTSGATILISHEKENIDNSNEINQEVRLRARKEVKEEEKEEDKPTEKKEESNNEKKEEKKEEKVEIEIEGQPEEEKDKKDVLRGPDGKPLLSEMLMYGGMDYTNQGQSNENNVNLYPVPQNYEPVVQPNMPGTKNTEYPPQVQPQPQPQSDINMMPNQNQMDYNNQIPAQNYPQQEINNNQGYQPPVPNTQNIQNPFEGQDAYNQNMPQPQQQENIPIPNVNIPQPQQQENIPIPNVNIPQPQQTPYPEYDPNLEQQQNMNYPEFSEQNNNNMMPQPKIPPIQPPSYESPYQQQPIEPIIPPTKEAPYQPQYEQYPPQEQPPMQPQMYPQEERPPMQPPMKPPMYPPMKPPMHRPMRPPMYHPPMEDHYYPGKKRMLPKRPIVQINIGGPMPYGYHAPRMIPHGPKHLFVNNRMAYDPVGEIIDFVADPVTYMVEKSLGLRSNKKKGEKEGDKKEEDNKDKKEEIKEEKNEEKKEIKVENDGNNKEPILRARKKETEEEAEPEYEEVEYAEDQENIPQQQEEVLCPECTNGENLCPECSGQNINENLCPECVNGENYYQNLCPECSGEKICHECSGEKICPECNNKMKNKINTKSKFNNFKFHEIVATSDNKKSFVVVKKEGIVISEK